VTIHSHVGLIIPNRDWTITIMQSFYLFVGLFVFVRRITRKVVNGFGKKIFNISLYRTNLDLVKFWAPYFLGKGLQWGKIFGQRLVSGWHCGRTTKFDVTGPCLRGRLLLPPKGSKHPIIQIFETSRFPSKNRWTWSQKIWCVG